MRQRENAARGDESRRALFSAVTTHATVGVSLWSITLISHRSIGSTMTASLESSEDDPLVAVDETA